MLFQFGEVLAAILTNQTSGRVLGYPVVNQLVSALAVKLFLAVPTLPFHLILVFLGQMLFFSMAVPFLSSTELRVDT